MLLRFSDPSGSPTLITVCFFSNSFAGVGGPGNNSGEDTYATATLSGDLFLTAGSQYQLQVSNPFIDLTIVGTLVNGDLPVVDPYCRWSMQQFA
jgi:hypothetical protein